MRVKFSEDNKKKCICNSCPSYDECMRGKKEILYCGSKKSSCNFKRNGCICGRCPVFKESNLNSGYFCSPD